MERKIFVTGNMQLGRPSAIGKWKRPFDNVDQMTKTLIDNWNSTVGINDDVYHIGNFAWDPKTAYDSLLALKGKNIYFIYGENDNALQDLNRRGNLQERFHICTDLYEQAEIGAILSFWPLTEWYKKNKGYYNITGYPTRKHKTNPKQKRINCSTDQCNFKPQNIHSIIGLIEEIK
jgi:calcineurin-like phosphoesterase family protein